MIRRIALILALGLAGCAAPQMEVPPVPPLAAQGSGTPAYNAIEGAAQAFGDPARLRGHPALAAVAVIRLEWVAEAVAADRSFYVFSGVTAPALNAARWEVRRALGISTDSPPAVVIAGLERAAIALDRGDRAAAAAALQPPVFSPDTLARLADMPRLPQANFATRRAQQDIEFGRSEDLDFP